MNDEEHLDSVIRHIRLVQDAGMRLAKKLSEKEQYLATKVLRNCMLHDISKLEKGNEWDWLRSDSKEANQHSFKIALMEHWKANKHHPEYWGGINYMPDECVAEMVCDWYARSCEQGTDFRKWIAEGYKNKFGNGTDQPRVTEVIEQGVQKFADMLLEPIMTNFKKEIERKEA
jgi:hypothetical protein